MPDRDLIPTPEEFERTKPKKKNFIARIVGRLRVKPGVGEEAKRISAPPAAVPHADEPLRLEEERESARRREREEEQRAAEARRLAEEQRDAEERRAAKRRQDQARKAAEAKRRAEAKRAAALAAEAERKAKAAPPAAPSRPARRITFREGVARPTQTHRGSVQGQTPSKQRESKRSTHDD